MDDIDRERLARAACALADEWLFWKVGHPGRANQDLPSLSFKLDQIEEETRCLPYRRVRSNR